MRLRRVRYGAFLARFSYIARTRSSGLAPLLGSRSGPRALLTAVSRTRLTGALLGDPSASPSMASGTGLLELATATWDAQALELAGVDERALPDLHRAERTGGSGVFEQERVEANYRFSLARLREYTEQVALLSGEPAERGRENREPTLLRYARHPAAARTHVQLE